MFHCTGLKKCLPDPFQFHLTKLTNHLGFPYDPSQHNHYSVGTSQPDLYQCRVVANLHGTVLDVTVYDNSGTQKGTGHKEGLSSNDVLTVDGLPLPLAVLYQEKQGDDSNPLAFNYGMSISLPSHLMSLPIVDR